MTESLGEKLAQGRLSPEEAVRVAREILVALERKEGRAYGELRPENVLVGSGGEVELSGSPREVAARARALLASGSLGKNGESIADALRYLSPEQREPDGEVDARADLYAWGVVLFEMLTGEPPSHAETPSQVLPGLDPRLDRIFRRACARAERRYESAKEALADLEPIVRSPAHRVEAADPVALQAARSVAPRAGLAPRALALALDLAPFLALALATRSFVLSLLSVVLYDFLAMSLLSGKTIGKLLAGIRVRDGEGRPPSIGRAALRALARSLSFAALGAGFLAVLGREKLAWHDSISGTRVEHSLPSRRT